MRMTPYFSEQNSAELVARRLAAAGDGKLPRFLIRAVEHVHHLVREANPGRADWREVLEFLTEVGHASDDKRQEWVLLSDLLGVSALVEDLNSRRPRGATPNGMRGLFYRPDAPNLPLGASISLDGNGEPLTVTGRVLDLDGKPVAGAVVETWQANGEGHYENQQPDLQPDFNLRGIFTADVAGRFQYSSVKPAGYSVPDDGPVGRLMRQVGLSLRRPAHLHFRICADGFETITTQLYDRADPDLARDAVFGVKGELVVDFRQDSGGAGWSVDYDFVMVRDRKAVRAA